MIYLDHAATTKPLRSVLDTYLEAQELLYFNSESLHVGGEIVKDTLRNARNYLQQHFSTDKDILFTTSGSHANEIAIRIYLENSDKRTVIVSPYEHLSVKAALALFAEKFDIVEMPLDDNGEINLESLKDLVNVDTALIIAQQVSSETGYQLPIAEIGEIARALNVPFHVDGVQAVQKIRDIDVDMATSYALSAHKFHGVKGSGALMMTHSFIRPVNQYYSHEQGARNGTLDVPGIIAMVKAVSLEPDFNHLFQLNRHAKKRAVETGCTVLSYDTFAPHIIGILTPKFEGQYIMQTLSNKNIAVSTGTACGHGTMVSSGLVEKIERAGGVVDQYIRISFSRTTTIEEIDACFDAIDEILKGSHSYEYSR